MADPLLIAQHGDIQCSLLPGLANRHGLVTGATGTGKTVTLQKMAEEFSRREQFHLAITPEGTRSLAPKWKMGFYHIAVSTKVPIQIACLDYAKKEAGVGKIVYPSGDMAKDLAEIMAFYAPIQGKHPENFSIDQRYRDPQ